MINHIVSTVSVRQLLLAVFAFSIISISLAVQPVSETSATRLDLQGEAMRLETARRESLEEIVVDLRRAGFLDKAETGSPTGILPMSVSDTFDPDVPQLLAVIRDSGGTFAVLRHEGQVLRIGQGQSLGPYRVVDVGGTSVSLEFNGQRTDYKVYSFPESASPDRP